MPELEMIKQFKPLRGTVEKDGGKSIIKLTFLDEDTFSNSFDDNCRPLQQQVQNFLCNLC